MGKYKKITDINGFPRPFHAFHEAQTRGQKLAMNLLQSGPTDKDNELGIQSNAKKDSNNLWHMVK